MFELVLVTALFICLLTFHVWGIVASIKKVRATFRVEKLAKSYGLDYNISNKFWMYVLCVLFSWLAYSAMSRLQSEGEEHE